MPREPGSEGADEQLREAGRALQAALVAAVPGWIRGEVARVLDTFSVAGGTVPGGPDGVLRQAEEAGERAAGELARALTALLAADVDAQWTTPLELVRQLVPMPTAVLHDAGVPPVERDRFAQERFPDDLYGLVPASLGAMEPGLADMALTWGAAKAAAHRARHAG